MVMVMYYVYKSPNKGRNVRWREGGGYRRRKWGALCFDVYSEKAIKRGELTGRTLATFLARWSQTARFPF